MPKLRQEQFYCVQCGKILKGYDIRIKLDKRGRPRMVAYDKRDHKVYKYVKWDDEERLREKFN